MTVRWAVGTEVSVSGLIPTTRVTDATPVLSTDFDARTFAPGTRFLIVLSAFETNVANTGGTWTVTESATDGGAYTACTLDRTLTATPATAGNDVQRVAVLPNPAKPFVLVTYTGADANAEVDITASLIALPREL